MGLKKDEINKAKNSSMTKDFKEMQQQGKMMEQLRTNKELKEDGKDPDPKQHE